MSPRVPSSTACPLPTGSPERLSARRVAALSPMSHSVIFGRARRRLAGEIRAVFGHGRRPSDATLHGKTGRVAGVVNIAGGENPQALARILSDGAKVETLLDTLYARRRRNADVA
jgi:hypothetical protein